MLDLAVAEGDQMRIFEDDVAGYLSWVASHPHAFVVNTFRQPDPRYLMLRVRVLPYDPP